MEAELTPGEVDSARHPSEVGEMSSSVLVEGHSISGIAALQEMRATWLLLNDGSGTFVNPSTGQSSPLDLTFVSSSAAARCEWYVH